jgi:ribosomal protein S18 acetylase RimI-like enzyme
MRALSYQPAAARGDRRAADQAAVAAKGSTEIRLSFEPNNIVAERLYASLGFERTGEIEEGEVVMRLRVQRSPRR